MPFFFTFLMKLSEQGQVWERGNIFSTLIIHLSVSACATRFSVGFLSTHHRHIVLCMSQLEAVLTVGFPAQTSNDESLVVFVTEQSLLVGQCVHTS